MPTFSRTYQQDRTNIADGVFLMSTSNDQGTGKHKHKSEEEPFPHHESGSGGQQSGRAEQRGRGEDESSGRSENRSEGRQSSGSESSDLKSREYKGSDGEVHHHTHTYEEQHKK
jgi:hypothetical protein